MRRGSAAHWNYETDVLVIGLGAGDTFVIAQGDLTISKPDADGSDIVRVDYLSYENGTETLYFIQDGSEVTLNMFSDVSSVVSTITKDGKNALPSTESIAVSMLSQPASGDLYKASYAFEAPLDGETLQVSYNYNGAIGDASVEVESRKSIFSDVLVKQVKETATRIGIELDVQSDASAISVQSQVSAAISNLFSTELADINTERRLDASDIIRATGGIVGIEDISVTTLSKNLITGEVQAPLVYERRESAVLEASSPRINTTQNGRVVSTRS